MSANWHCIRGCLDDLCCLMDTGTLLEFAGSICWELGAGWVSDEVFHMQSTLQSAEWTVQAASACSEVCHYQG